VFSEKPMATSLPEAWKIRQAAGHARGLYQLGFNRRFANVYRFAKQMIDEGRITHSLTPLPRAQRAFLPQSPDVAWRYQRARSSALLLPLSIRQGPHQTRRAVSL